MEAQEQREPRSWTTIGNYTFIHEQGRDEQGSSGQVQGSSYVSTQNGGPESGWYGGMFPEAPQSAQQRAMEKAYKLKLDVERAEEERQRARSYTRIRFF